MRLLDRFRKAPAMTGPAELEEFLDRQAAFMVQKCIYEYARARSGVLSSKLFKGPLSRRRWKNCAGATTRSRCRAPP